MTAQKFTKRPDEVEAMQFDGDNAPAIVRWATNCVDYWREGDNPFTPCPGWWIKQELKAPILGIRPSDPSNFAWHLVLPSMFSSEKSQRETQQAAVGDWIVRIGLSFTVMKPEAFAKAYAPVFAPEFDIAPMKPTPTMQYDDVSSAPQVILSKATLEDINELKAINTRLAEERRSDWSKQHPEAAQTLDKPLAEGVEVKDPLTSKPKGWGWMKDKAAMAGPSRFTAEEIGIIQELIAIAPQIQDALVKAKVIDPLPRSLFEAENGPQHEGIASVGDVSEVKDVDTSLEPEPGNLSAETIKAALVEAMMLRRISDVRGRLHLLDVAVFHGVVVVFCAPDSKPGFHAAMRTDGVEPVIFFDFEGPWTLLSREEALGKILVEAGRQRVKAGLA